MKSKLLRTIAQAFSPMGFQRTRSGLLLRKANLDTLVAIGVTSWTDRQTGSVGVAINVGVRNEGLHDLMHKLMPRSPQGPCCIALLTNVGYLGPQRRWQDWTVRSEEEIQTVVESIVAAFRQLGGPFVSAYSDLQSVLEAPVIYRNSVTWLYAQPCACLVNRDFAGVRASVQRTLADLAGTPGSAFEVEFRSFAGKIEEYIAAHDGGAA